MMDNATRYLELIARYHATPDQEEAAAILDQMLRLWSRMTDAECEAVRNKTHSAGKPIPEGARP